MSTTAEKIIIAAILDAAIEDAVKERQEREELLNNLIGKKYFNRESLVTIKIKRDTYGKFDY